MSNFVNMSNEATLMSVLKVLKENIFDTMNCIKIGYIDSYDYLTRVSKVIIYNKRVVGLNDKGEHILEDYPPLYCKTLFLGSKLCGINWSVQKGDECIVFFTDKELETPWISGQVSDVKYSRMHDYTDAICLTGFTTLPQTLPTDINLNITNKNGIIYIDGDTVIDGNAEVNGNLLFGGDLIVRGNLVVEGSADIAGDATIGGISFLEHMHPTPAGDSGVPQ